MLKMKLILLASVAVLPLAQAFAQTADQPAAAGGAIALPTVEVTATDGGGEGGGAGNGPPESPGEKAGYSAPSIQQSTTKIAVPTFDLPIAIQTVPEQVIIDQNAVNIQDALENVSGVRSSNNNIEGYVFNIRGFNSFNVLRDGLLIGVAIPQSYDTANLQSVDVLKGPASFLFGRADPGGVINLVTKKPLDTPYYSIEQQMGSFNMLRSVWDLTGPVDIPDLDKGAVSYRFSGSYQDGGQWVDFTETRSLLLAPSITWKIDPSTKLTVEAQYNREDGRSNTGQPAIGAFPANIPVSRSFLDPNEPQDTVRSSLISYNFRHEFDNNWAITNRFLAARATIEKTDLTGNCFFFQDPAAPAPCVVAGNTLPAYMLDRGITYQKLTGTNYSANLDLTGKFYVANVRNDVLIGTDYFYSFYNYVLSGNGDFPINIYNPVYGTVPYWEFASAATMAWSGTSGFRSFSSNQQRDLGIYAQDSITLFDNLHILVGGRYDLADVRSGNSNNFTGAGNFAEASANFDANPDQHNQAFSPRIGVNYQPVPWLGFYGSYTKSFGAANGLSNNNLPLPPEIAEGWEGGVKTELLDHRLTTTLAFFTITKSNVLTSTDPFNPIAESRPIGQVRSQGVELDALGKLTNEISIIASYAHLDTKVIKDTVPDPLDPFAGGLLGLTPGGVAPNSGSLFLAYEFPAVSMFHGWRAGGGVYAVGDRWGDNQDTFILPAYARLDAFAAYKAVFGPTRWTAQVNLQNIANTNYYPGTDFFFNNAPRFGIYTGTPRAVTVSLKVEY
ncbi:TonB-dependent siderophore receptor [Methylocapsa sp. D3K7]|uniref:TonB-dependent siderophore receptor n=1 Tax=Methylocapsa sp. D3K7 TaxID=3041435 RepID=UPI00244E941B|nr:TonB-dependent siderophore receptor [Methylocapsa sp. D3K7]WGJ15719.1 TonB-dependent siderophore receptor [Methylocapsa sp. D3K7]